MADNNNIDELNNEVDTEENTAESSEAVNEAAGGEDTNAEVFEGEVEETTSEEAEAEETETDGEGAPQKEKKGFFKKDKKDKKDEKIEELTAQYKRTLAEFDNYRKRTEKEKAAMFEVGAKNIVEKILPVVDNFERGLATVPEEQKNDAFVEGMDKIYKQLVKQLEDAGVKEIEALGKEFDPNVHNAVMHVEDESVGEQIIVEVFQKGYTYRDSVVRCSMVKVAN